MGNIGRRILALAPLCHLLASGRAYAEGPSRPPLPEALLTESATDIDAEDAGELEWEANLARFVARVGGAGSTLTGLEVEWRALKELGLRVDPSYARIVDVGATSARTALAVGGALAFGLFHDFARDLHVQAELAGRTAESANAQVFEPGESELPFAADLLGTIRRGRWTLRATVGAEAGAAFSHAPVHTDLAILTGILPEERFGFVAIEVRADWAREAPLVVAPEIVADATPVGLPFRLGLALPVNVGADATSPSYGLLLRLILLTSREVVYGERGGD